MSVKLSIKRASDGADAPPLDEYTFEGPIITIGSDETASLILRGAGVAAEQVVVLVEELLLINRADGTALNQEALGREARRPIGHGDRLRIGDYVIIFQLPQAAAGSSQPASGAQRRSADRAFADLAETATTPPAPPAPPTLAETTPPGNGDERGQRNFAMILDSLRTEEDSFYFLIEGGTQHSRRIPIGNAEMPLGWDETGQNLAFDAAGVVAQRAVVRKDWSGVIVQAQLAAMVIVNGEPIESVRRLRNGDRLMIVPTANTSAQSQAFLVFHEPASLVVLDSLLPQKMPPPVPLQSPAEMAASLAQTASPAAAALAPNAPPERAVQPSAPRKIFGYFTLVEVLIMIIATLALAAIVFLLLDA